VWELAAGEKGSRNRAERKKRGDNTEGGDVQQQIERGEQKGPRKQQWRTKSRGGLQSGVMEKESIAFVP